MATNFPTSLDVLTNPTSSDSLSSPSHSAQHANVNDAVEALQAKVGADSSAVTSSLDYKVAQLESGATGGKIVQVVLGTFSQFTTTATTEQQVTTLNITPTSSTSKIIAWVSTTCRATTGPSHTYNTAHVNINNTTSGTNVKWHDLYQEVAANDNITNSLDMWGVDEPASTSTQTYELTLYMPSTSGSVRLAHIGTGGREGEFMLMEVAS